MFYCTAPGEDSCFSFLLPIRETIMAQKVIFRIGSHPCTWLYSSHSPSLTYSLSVRRSQSTKLLGKHFNLRYQRDKASPLEELWNSLGCTESMSYSLYFQYVVQGFLSLLQHSFHCICLWHFLYYFLYFSPITRDWEYLCIERHIPKQHISKTIQELFTPFIEKA